MGHINLFENENQFLTWKDSEEYVVPNVCYIRESDSVIYAITKTSEKEYKIVTASKKAILGLTYNAVDLGLPSGTLWADRNVGAASPEDYGTYFAWGETDGITYDGVKNITAEEVCNIFNPMLEPQGIIMTLDNIDEILSMAGLLDNTNNCVLGNILPDKCFSPDWSDYFDTTDGGNTFIKYNNNGGFTVLQPEDDAATVNMGSDWRMPTRQDMYELLNNTTIIFIDDNGNEFKAENGYNTGELSLEHLKGVKFIGINGNSIFIPNSGSCEYSILWVKYGTILPFSDYNGKYCRGLAINGDYVWCGLMNDEKLRCAGLSIRGVKSK